MQFVEEIAEALACSDITIRAMQMIGSGHMRHDLPVKDVVLLTWDQKLPTHLRGFWSVTGHDGKWWRSNDGCNIRFAMTPQELSKWRAAADAVRQLYLRGNEPCRDDRIAMYRVIVDGAAPV